MSAGAGFGQDTRSNTKGTGNDVARWTFDVTPGQYRISVTWVASAGNATDAPYTVFEGNSALRTVRINQQAAPNDLTDRGVAWEDLGETYVVAGNKLQVRLTDAANQRVVADAVRIQHVGTLGPEIEVLDGTRSIADGGEVDFGTVLVDVPVERTLTVRNTGLQALTLTPLSPSALPAGFTLVSNLQSTNLAPGESTTFAIRFQAGSTGSFVGPVSLTSNDPDESPFDLNLKGTATTVQVIDDGDAGFSAVGTWQQSTGSGFGGDVRASTVGTGSDVATWTFQVAPGRYRVAATWPAAANRAIDAPLTVWDGAAQLATVDVDQREAPADFVDRGARGTSSMAPSTWRAPRWWFACRTMPTRLAARPSLPTPYASSASMAPTRSSRTIRSKPPRTWGRATRPIITCRSIRRMIATTTAGLRCRTAN